MGDDDGIPIAGGDATEQLLAVLRLEILLAGGQDVRTRIQRQQLGGKLTEHVIGDDKQRLAGNTEPSRLHRGGGHRVGFACANDVGQQRVRRLQNAPDPGLLMRVKLNCAARAGQRQMVAVERADARVIERVVVEAAKPFPARVVGPNPFLELFLDALLFFASGLGRLRVDDGFLVHRVIDRGRFKIERVFNQFQRRVTVSAPIRRVRGCAACLPIRIDVPRTEGVDVPDLDARRDVEQFVRELLHVFGWQPGCAQPHVNFGRGQVRWLDRFQRLDVLGKARVGH